MYDTAGCRNRMLKNLKEVGCNDPFLQNEHVCVLISHIF